MNLHIEKLNLIQWITELNDISVIEKLREIKSESELSSDWWDEISRDAKESIENGLKDIQEGRIHTHQTVRKTYEKYL